jgi:hypothetical protein
MMKTLKENKACPTAIGQASQEKIFTPAIIAGEREVVNSTDNKTTVPDEEAT